MSDVNRTLDRPTDGSVDSINEFVLAGEFGFKRVDGPFAVEKVGTRWTIDVPDDYDRSFLIFPDEDPGTAVVLIADCEAVGGGVVEDVIEPDEGGYRILVDQYVRGEPDV